MKVYVAGKFTDKENIQAKMKNIEKLGCVITFDWTRFEDEDLTRAAEKAIIGVKTCDIVIVIMDDKDYSYRGTFTEVGIAIGTNKIIFLYNPNKDASCDTNVFYHAKEITHFKQWHMLLNEVEKVANEKIVNLI